MKYIRIIFISVTSVIEAGLLSLIRFRLRLPYENGRFFDAGTGIVYKEEAIEAYTFLFVICTILLIIQVYRFIKKWK